MVDNRQGSQMPLSVTPEGDDDRMVSMPAMTWQGGPSAENGIRWRWLIVLLLLVAVGTTLWDAWNGSLGNAAASAIYLVLLVLEVFWWPKRQAHLLANADRAAALAAQVDVAD